MKIALFGPPGAGKGTQAPKISDAYGIPHISTGAMLAEMANRNNQLGEELREVMYERGGLVDDGLTTRIVRERLSNTDCRNGYILDGYPRNDVQAADFERIDSLHHIILLDVGENEAITRLPERQICRPCNLSYGPMNQPKDEGKCNRCYDDLTVRPDDDLKTAVERITTYKIDTAPVIEFYDSRGLLRTINGAQSVDDVFKDIQAVLGHPSAYRIRASAYNIGM